ncbi:hypothetical protein PC114_g20974 [Phytophthora cactorum]|nr:hypothetical protein PC114_g20974 [Phytophthora cactorum]
MRKNKSMCVTSQWLLLMLFALSTGRSLDAAVVSIRRFRLRNRLSVRVITHRGTKKRSELQEVADKFSRTITYNLEMVGLIAGIQGADRYESVFNMDQTSIYIDMGPKRTTELNLSEPKMWMLFKECHKTRLCTLYPEQCWKRAKTAMEPKRPGRTRGENGKRRHQHMFKRRVDTYQVRLAAINHYREHRNMDYTLAKFYPGVEGALRDTKRKSIYLWEKKRARIEEICTTTKGGQLKIVRDLGTATVLSHDAERKIVQWIGEMPSTPQQRSSSYCDALSQPSESTAVANELLALGQLDRVFREVQEGSDVVENAVVGVFEVLADDEEE